MMTAERRAADQKIKEENLFKSLGAGEQEAETEGFQCGRCKQASRIFHHRMAWQTPPQRKCRYRQAQTRSADEPMTTFVTYVHLARIGPLADFSQMCRLWKQVSEQCPLSLSSGSTVSPRWKFS